MFSQICTCTIFIVPVSCLFVCFYRADDISRDGFEEMILKRKWKWSQVIVITDNYHVFAPAAMHSLGLYMQISFCLLLKNVLLIIMLVLIKLMNDQCVKAAGGHAQFVCFVKR